MTSAASISATVADYSTCRPLLGGALRDLVQREKIDGKES